MIQLEHCLSQWQPLFNSPWNILLLLLLVYFIVSNTYFRTLMGFISFYYLHEVCNNNFFGHITTYKILSSPYLIKPANQTRVETAVSVIRIHRHRVKCESRSSGFFIKAVLFQLFELSRHYHYYKTWFTPFLDIFQKAWWNFSCANIVKGFVDSLHHLG